LEGQVYIDKVNAYKECQQQDIFIIENELNLNSSINNYFIDRIYKNAPNLVVLKDNNTNIAMNIIKSNSWGDYVIFNPWVEGKKGIKGPDFDDDGYNYMLCIEPANATTSVDVAPGTTWKGSVAMNIEYL